MSVGESPDCWVFGVIVGYRILISSEVRGQGRALRWLRDYRSKGLQFPQHEDWLPDVKFVRWHHREVFWWPAAWARWNSVPPNPSVFWCSGEGLVLPIHASSCWTGRRKPFVSRTYSISQTIRGWANDQLQQRRFRDPDLSAFCCGCISLQSSPMLGWSCPQTAGFYRGDDLHK